MIYDKIDSLGVYAGMSEDILAGLEYLRDLTPDVEKGVYEIRPRVKAIVSEYITKEINENGYETHREYIDIQYLLYGKEKINCLPLEYLRQIKEYSKEKDAAFYEEGSITPQELLLGNGYFAIFFPQDGHMPQLCVDKQLNVKKVVVKVKIKE